MREPAVVMEWLAIALGFRRQEEEAQALKPET